jgi:hypothetical protein
VSIQVIKSSPWFDVTERDDKGHDDLDDLVETGSSAWPSPSEGDIQHGVSGL